MLSESPSEVSKQLRYTMNQENLDWQKVKMKWIEWEPWELILRGGKYLRQGHLNGDTSVVKPLKALCR
jgi:hypothetical protein